MLDSPVENRMRENIGLVLEEMLELPRKSPMEKDVSGCPVVKLEPDSDKLNA